MEENNNDKNPNKTEDKQEDPAQERRNHNLGALVLISMLIILFVVCSVVLPALDSSRMGATSVINQSTEDGYYEKFFK